MELIIFREAAMRYSFNSYYLDAPLVKGRVFDVFFPEGDTRPLALFFVHGGGWRAGSRQSFHKFMEIFSDMGYAVASTDYRLDARDAFVQLTDVREAYARFVALLRERGVKNPRVAVMGESAGAHLASLLSYTEPRECGEEYVSEEPWVKPVLTVLAATPVDFCPFGEMLDSSRSMMESAAGVSYDECPEVYERLSLKNYIREDNPKTFFVEAELEHLFASSDTRAVCDMHNAMGIGSQWKVYPKMEHGFLYTLTREGQRAAFADICSFLAENE